MHLVYRLNKEYVAAVLKHWGRDNTAAISQTIFSWLKSFVL